LHLPGFLREPQEWFIPGETGTGDDGTRLYALFFASFAADLSFAAAALPATLLFFLDILKITSFYGSCGRCATLSFCSLGAGIYAFFPVCKSGDFTQRFQDPGKGMTHR
jgi:hypothetical protein